VAASNLNTISVARKWQLYVGPCLMPWSVAVPCRGQPPVQAGSCQLRLEIQNHLVVCEIRGFGVWPKVALDLPLFVHSTLHSALCNQKLRVVS